MPIYGMTADGFNRKRQINIKTELEEDYKVAFGENIDLQADSVFGQEIGINSEALADQWESQENIYNSQYPNTAEKIQLSNVVKLNGLTRLGSEHSTVTVTLSGTAGTVITAGSKISTLDTGTVFETLADATIGGGGTIDAAAQSEEAGAFEATAGTLTNIDTPIYGWTAVTNASDATVGRSEETDAELRLRQQDSTLAAGQNNADSLFGQLRNISGVADALVVENKTNTTSASGIPPHEFECFVKGGSAADIAQTIWTNTPQGIQSHGDVLEVVEDAQGFEQDVYYTIPGDINIYVKANITTNSDFPVTGVDDIKASVVSYGETNFLISDDVIYSQLFSPIHQTSGIVDVILTIGISSSPTGTVNIPIDFNEISAWDISRVEVNIV